MDVHALTNLFATTYSPDQNVRKAAELEITRVGNEEGMITACMQIIAQNNLDLPVRQACAVWMKNRLKAAYLLDPTQPADGKRVPIALSDRAAIKQNILPLLVAAPSRAIRVQLASCIKTVVASDFPEEWPGLLDSVLAMLTSDDLASVYGGLLVTNEVIKAFKYRLASAEMIPQIVEKLFPTLVSLGQKLTSTSPPPPISPLEGAEFLHLIIKCYKASTMQHLSKAQQKHDSIVPWGTLLFQVVNMQLPAGTTLPGDKDEWEKHAWWKAKKWSYSTLNRLFDRFGNPSQLPGPMKKDYSDFANHFVTTFAPEIFKMYLTQVELYVGSGSWISKRCLHLIFAYFSSCIKPKSTWQLLKPHAQTLVSRFVFPQLCFNQERAELWEADPIEYVRSSIDEFEDQASPKAAATAFLYGLASKRTKIVFMPILTFVNAVLAGNPKPEEKYGALTTINALGPIIMRNPEVKPVMETFLVNHVLPEFSSPTPYLREIACHVVGTLSNFRIEWQDPKNHEAHFRALLGALDDPELAVRVPAAVSLTETIHHKDVQTALAPNIETIMQALFKLSDETDLDVISTCMESFIDVFKEQLLPVSPQLIARLCQSYTRLLGEQVVAEAQDDGADPMEKINADTDDKTFALMGSIKTIQTILASMDELEMANSQPILAEITEIVIPIIMQTLQSEMVELFDGVWELVDTLTFRARAIVPGFWPVYVKTYELFKSSAVDYLEEMLPGLCNFLLFGKEAFVQHPEYTRMALEMFETSLTNPHLGENDAVNGCKLVESILLNLKGHIDDAIPSIIQATMKVLDKPPETAALKLAALDVLVTVVWYNPVLALHAFESTPGGSRSFFDKWFVAVAEEGGLPRVHDKKLTILTLCDLLKLDPAVVPPSVKEGWNGLVSGILNVFKGLPAAQEQREALLAEFEDEEGEDSEDMDIPDDGEDGDEDGDVWDEDSAYLELLAEESERLRAKQAPRVAKAAATKEIAAEAQGHVEVDGESQEDEESEEGSIAEDLGIETIIDDIDPYAYFKQALTDLQMSNPAFYQALTTSLTVDQQAELMSTMATAEEHEKEAAQESEVAAA